MKKINTKDELTDFLLYTAQNGKIKAVEMQNFVSLPLPMVKTKR
jgi:hypothetical protein